MTLLARRYATALHLAARERDAVAQVEGDLAALHTVLAAEPVRALLTSPDVGRQERSSMVAKLARGRHELVGNLLQVVLRRHRQEVLFDLQPAFRALVQEERGEVDGVVETPRPLGANDLAQLQALARQLSGKQVTLSMRVRPELIGGVRLFVGNVLYDGSVQTSLHLLEQRLLQASI